MYKHIHFGFLFLIITVLKFFFILIIAIPRTAAELKDVGFLKAATEVFGVLLDDSFALDGFLGGVYEILRDEKTDIVLIGEACEYHQCEYARDAAELGINKAMVVLGHEGSERAGMRYLAKLLSEKHPELKIDYVECGEVYN